MSFLTNLGKGFIRSAVNQVGRDTGKVISNSIYGDAHATPIRNVSKTDKGIYVDNINGEPINPEELRNRAWQEGWKPVYSLLSSYGMNLSTIIAMSTYLVIGIVFYPYTIKYPILPILIFLFGICNIFRKTVEWKRKANIPYQVSDRRYRGGYRIEHRQRNESVYLPCNDSDKKKLLFYGAIYIVVAIAFYIIASVYGKSWQEMTTAWRYEEIINNREQSIKDSIKARQDIEFWKKYYDDETYKSRLEEFNKEWGEKYEEYLEALKSIQNQ